jgi:mono/diheme cytochrome c family protein
MSFSKRSVFTAAAAFAAAGSVFVSASRGEDAAKPTAGFYTEAQAERGEKVYEEACASCHGADLTGAPGAPGLSGAEFSFGWNKKSVGDLYTFIHDNMPLGEPGGLNPEQYADLTAVILKANKYPTGDAELKPDAEALKTLSLAKP